MVENVELTRFWRPTIPLTGNIWGWGRIGSGKTYKLLAVTQFYHAAGYKLWDLFGGKRGEGSYWCFPSDETRLWHEFESVVGEMEVAGPKEYEVDLVYPYFESKIPDSLPEASPRIISKPMTIFFKDISLEEIATVLGNISMSSRYVWNYICKNLPDSANGADILALFESKMPLAKHKESSIYKLFIQPMCENKILSSKNSKYTINFIEEADNKNRIFVLNDDYTPDDFKLFIIAFVMGKIVKCVLEDKIHKHNILIFREISLFMKVQDESVEFSEQKQVMRNILTNAARYARSGFFIAAESQSYRECAGLCEGSEDLTLISETPGQKDREDMCGQLVKDRRMSNAQVAYISIMPREQVAVIERGKKAKLVKRIQPPRNKCWKQGEGNFLSEYKRRINLFKKITPEKENIINEYKERLFLIEEMQQRLAKKNIVEDEYNEEETSDETLLEEVNIKKPSKLVPKDDVNIKEEMETVEKQEDKDVINEKILLSKQEIQDIEKSSEEDEVVGKKIELTDEDRKKIKKQKLLELIQKTNKMLGKK